MPQHRGMGSGSIVIQLRSSLSRSCTNGLVKFTNGRVVQEPSPHPLTY